MIVLLPDSVSSANFDTYNCGDGESSELVGCAEVGKLNGREWNKCKCGSEVDGSMVVRVMYEDVIVEWMCM